MTWAPLVAQLVKKSASNIGDLGLIPGLGRSPGEGKGYPLQYSPGEFHGRRSLAGYSPWGHKGLDTTKQLTLFLLFILYVSLQAILNLFLCMV